MEAEETVKVDEFKFFGSTVQSNRQNTREVKKRVTRMDRIRNEDIRDTVHVRFVGDTIREAGDQEENQIGDL